MVGLFLGFQVSKVWNDKISIGFNRFWFTTCRDLLPVKSDEFITEDPEVNYKCTFVDILRRSSDLEAGRLFHKWDLAPLEINALASYKNIIATGEHDRHDSSYNTSSKSSQHTHHQNHNSHVYVHTHAGSHQIIY